MTSVANKNKVERGNYSDMIMAMLIMVPQLFKHSVLG